MTNLYDTTMYPLGSTKPKVVANNASNFDEAMNSTSPSFDDRTGKRRQTWAGAEYEWQQLMQNTAFELPPLVYVDGSPLVVSRPTQLISRAGNLYRAVLPQTFPLNLTGTWATDEPKLTFVSDSALRAQLGNFASDSDGAAIVARSAVVVASVAKLATVPRTMGQEAITMGWHAGKYIGGGEYVYISSTAKSLHDGVCTISPTVPFTTRDDFLNGVGESDPSGSGCWQLKLGGAQLTVAHGGAYCDASASDLLAINKTLASAARLGISAVRNHGRCAVNDSVRIPDNVTFWGPRSSTVEAMLTWAHTGERRIITNADWDDGNTGPIVAGLTIIGRVTGGSQFDHGVHFGGTISAGILDVTIKDCQGDGICLGNFFGGVPALCVNTRIENPEISNCRRQGIAFTCSEGATVTNPYIYDLQAAIVGGGVAIDFEPDDGEIVRNNKVIGGLCRNVKSGVILSSVSGFTAANTLGNSVTGMTIDGTTLNGILCAFWDTDLSGNTFVNIGQHGIIVTSSAGVQGVTINGNKILSAGVETGDNYSGIFFDSGVAHCEIGGNIISATALKYTINTFPSAGYNTIVGNQTRAAAKPMNLNPADDPGHNTPDGSVQVDLHAGFTSTGIIDVGNFGFTIGGARLYPVSGVPSDANGSNGDIAINTSTTGALFYKKIAGTWVAQ